MYTVGGAIVLRGYILKFVTCPRRKVHFDWLPPIGPRCRPFVTTPTETAMSARSLLARLIRAVGPEYAPNELRWMQQACARQDDKTLEDMVTRREGGEPLQYILGLATFPPVNLQVRHAE